METAIAEKPTRLRGAERANAGRIIYKSDLPWLPEQEHEVHLIKIRTGKKGFLFGSAIRGRKLVEAASQLDTHRSNICNNLLYTHLSQFAEGFNPHVKMVQNPRTRQPIFYVSNEGGQRVYFMRFGNLDFMPIIIKIATCDKATQTDVLATITTDSLKQIKARIS